MKVRSLAEAKTHLSELVARAGTEHERFTLTVHGRPAAVLLAVEDLEALEETIAMLSDAVILSALGDRCRAGSRRGRGCGEPRNGRAGPASLCVNDQPYVLVIAPTARRQLAERLPEAVAFAA